MNAQVIVFPAAAKRRPDSARIHRSPRIPFFSTQYRPAFVEAVTIVSGFVSLAIIGGGKLLGML